MTPMGLGIGLGLADGGKGNTSGLNAGDGTIVVDDAGNWDIVPFVKDDPTGLKLNGKNGGVAKFIFDIGPAVANTIYTMRYSADWSLLSNLGAEAFFGFGWKEADNDFHLVGNKGNGLLSSFGIDIKRIWGTANFNGQSGFSDATDIPDNGTQEGPNWLRLTIANDGSTYTLASSSDGITFVNEIIGVVPIPMVDATTPTTFGIAVFLENSDKGEFEAIVELWVQGLTPPSPVAFANFTTPAATGNFSISTADLGGQTPIGAYIWLANAEVTDVVYTGGFIGYHAHGCTDGTTSWAGYGYVVNSSNSDLKGRVEGKILAVGSAGTYIEATFVSFEADGMTINFSTLAADGQDKLGHVMFITGDNSSCKAGVFNNINPSVTIDLGFAADAMFTYSSTTENDAHPGTCDGMFGIVSNTAGAPQYNMRYFRASGGGSGYAYNTGMVTTGVVASFSGNDAILTDTGGGDVMYFAFSFGGDLSVICGDFSSPTSATTVNETGLGFTPEKLLILGGPVTASWATAIISSSYSVSWLDDAGNAGSIAHVNADGYGSTTQLWNNSGGEKAVLDSVASGEFTMDFTIASGTAQKYPYMAFGK